jgi:phage FluMu protein gp41
MIASAVTAHDEWIDRAIASAREQHEIDTGMVLISSTWKQTYSHFPHSYVDDAIDYEAIFVNGRREIYSSPMSRGAKLLKRPVSSIASVTYVDMSGNTQTLSADKYRLDTGSVQPCLEWDDTATFPSVDERAEAVTITYVAGYANAAAVPADVKSLLLLRIQREWELHAGMSNAQAGPLDRAIESLTNRRVRSTYP